MFVVYMNDIVRCSIELSFLMYADDTTLHVSGVDTGQCTSIMNQGLSHVYRWLYSHSNSNFISCNNYYKQNKTHKK